LAGTPDRVGVTVVLICGSQPLPGFTFKNRTRDFASIVVFKRRLDIVCCVSFCLLLVSLLAYDLRTSYAQAESEARVEISNSSFLISEWIKGAFESSDYVLRDIVERVAESGSRPPASHFGEHGERMDFLESKRKTLPSAFTVALYDGQCLATHSHTSPRFDASSREYCRVLRGNPAIDSMVTHAFHSSLGRLNVVQARRIPGDQPGFHGFALIGIDLGFFSGLVSQVSTGKLGNVVVMDSSLVILARKPAVASRLGTTLNNPALRDFVASRDSMRILSIRSELDGHKRLSCVRKVGDLPFVVAVGISEEEWLARWKSRVRGELVAAFLLCCMAVMILRNHRVLTERTIRLEQANGLLAALSMTDGLTGLANRRRFDQVLASEWARAQRSHENLALVMLDVDWFKKFNDRYGHPAGDECLKQIATVLQSSVQRTGDLAARYGGEEFALILPGASQEAACHIAETIREKIRTLNISNESSSEGLVTLSIGVASLTDPERMDAGMLLFAADDALYQAKQHGRNQVRSAAPLP